ncbi:unnamed protein product, partial [Phaeothamnion confervicola]
MSMFWLDATEVEGTLYLIGKVELGEGTGVFGSVCVVVHNVQRSLLVLPRRLPGDEAFCEESLFSPGLRYGKTGEVSGANGSFEDPVHGEISSLLVPSVIPRSHEGEKFRAKPVARRYAFEHTDVPRDPTTYLKVKYSARYPPPPLAACESGGKSFQRIFGARTSAVENFLLKRRLMGPCWLTVRAPVVPVSPCSWCRVEVTVEDPKKIAAAPAPFPPAPPVVTLSLSLKTVVHPSTHANEIVAMAAVVHREAKLDHPTEDSGPAAAAKMTGWAAVRPLGAA